MTINKLLSAAVVATVVTGASVAANADTGFYAKLGGSFVSHSKKLKVTDNSIADAYGSKSFAHKAKNGVAINVAAGYKVQPNVRAELELIFDQTKFKSFENTNGGTKLESTAPKIRSNVFLANAYYDFDMHEHFKPYVMLGLGFNVVKAKSFSWKKNGAAEITAKKGSSATYAYNIGLGAQVPFNETVALDLGVRYFDYGKVKWKSNDGSNINIKYNMRGVAVTTGVAISF